MNALAVLMPVFRNQSGLNRSLESLRQAAGRFDVIVVDDGSPAPLQASASLRDDVLVSVVRLERNEGIAKALNRGLSLAFERGYDFIARLDAGDMVAPERFVRQSQYLRANPSCGAVASSVDFLDARHVRLFSFRAPPRHPEIIKRLRIENCLMHPSTMLRAEAMRKVGGYREDTPGAEDYDLFLRMARDFTLAVLPESLTRMEYDPTGLSVAGRRQQQRTRLRLQLEHFDPCSVYSFVGVTRSLLAMFIPHAAVHRYKRAFMN